MAYSLERNLKDADGVPIIGAQTYVYTFEGALATVVTADGDPATNPVVSGAGGYSAIFVGVVGRYTLKHYWAGRERLIEIADTGGPAIELPASTDGTLISNTDGAVPTVKAVKTYADTKAASSGLAATGGAALVGFLQSGTGATARTVQAKLGDIPSTADFTNQAALESNAADWFLMPDGTDLTVAGALTKNFFGPGSISLAGGDTPGTQGDATYGFSVFQSVTPASGQIFAGAYKVFSGTRYDTSSAPGQNHAVALYTEAQRGSGSDGVWAFNPLVEVRNLDAPTIGIEVDVNNFSGSDPGLDPANVFHALSLISGASGRGGTAMVIDRNGDYAGNQWNRGIHVKEVLLRGIEFTNCGAASGFWSDRTLAFVQTAATDNSVARFTPYSDTGGSNYLMFLTNAANSVVLAGWLKRGEISIGGNANQGSCGVGIKGIANGDNVLFLQRNTDTGPSGTFIRAVNAGNSSVLFDVDYNATALETNLKLSVAGASAARVSVGAADSGGTGYRVLRVPN